MQSYTQSVSSVQPEPARQTKRDDLTYQLMTIAAMLVVLVSIWVF